MGVIDVVALLLRLWLGTVMAAHGINHLRSREGTRRWFRSVGFRRPGLHAALSGVGEVAIAVALALGVFTPFAAAGLIGVMTVAFWSIHRFAGFYVFARPDEGYEYVVTLVVAAMALAVLGPGSVSIDGLWAMGGVDGWAGAAIAAGGVVVAAVVLAAGWRRPPSAD